LAAALEGGGRIENYETELVRKDGARIVVSTNARAIRDAEGKLRGIDGVLRDITALKRAEDGLKAAVEERETLLMELYHRTNNNMQIISSLLKLQADILGDSKVEELAQSVSSRIHAMSLVYEKLYRSGSLSRIDVKEYVEELVPLGLVINEIVGNSFKHAFPGDRKGLIRISLRRLDAKSIVLEVSDDGVGLPPGVDPLATSSFGLSTMVNIARLQMRGSVEVRREAGLAYRITMRDRLYEERV
jgi:two-component sensor histidine kinase